MGIQNRCNEVDICDLCESTGAELIGEERISVPTTAGATDFRVRLVCCAYCGLVFQHPPQDEEKLRHYYAHMYREENCRPRHFIEQDLIPRIDFINQTAGGGEARQVLEIGCADGTVLEGLRALDFRVAGIEPSLENAGICRQKGIAVFQGSYDDYQAEAGAFDLVSSYFVIEHLRSPVHFLSFCNHLLEKGGLLILELPDIAAYRQEPGQSNLLFFYEHLYHFTRETIELALRRCGFSPPVFGGQPSYRFGMLLAAEKIGDPSPPSALSITQDIREAVMDQIDGYRAYRQRETQAFVKKALYWLGEREDMPRRVALFGAGDYARMLLQVPGVRADAVAVIFDNNPSKWDGSLFGIPIRPPNLEDAVACELIAVLGGFHGEMRQQLLDMGVNGDKIIAL